MAEWLKAPVSKTGMGETLSGVQISLSPPIRVSSGIVATSLSSAVIACYNYYV